MWTTNTTAGSDATIKYGETTIPSQTKSNSERKYNSYTAPVYGAGFVEPGKVQQKATSSTSSPFSFGSISVSSVRGLQFVGVVGLAWFVFFRSPELPSGPVLKTDVSPLSFASDLAPVSSKQLTPEMVADYVGRFSDVARQEQKQFGIPASVSLAQGLVESRAGNSKLAQKNNNHFGLKCFSRHCKSGHCSNFTDDTHKDFFLKFKSPWESWRAHSKLLMQDRYKNCRGGSYSQWAWGLQKAGYATDKTYADKLIGVIEEYQLYKYDL